MDKSPNSSKFNEQFDYKTNFKQQDDEDEDDEYLQTQETQGSFEDKENDLKNQYSNSYDSRTSKSNKQENNIQWPQTQKSKQDFMQLCMESDLKKDKECKICKISVDGVFQSRKNCLFCGNSVCADCSKRKKANPQKPEEFVRICDQCHQQILYNKIMDKYLDRKIKRDEYSQKIEKQYEQAQTQLKLKQQQLDNLQHQAQKRQDLQIKNQQSLLDQIQNSNDKIMQVEVANQRLNEEFGKINTQIKEITNKIENQRLDYDQLVEQSEKLNRNIEQSQVQIKQLTQIYTENDEYLSQRRDPTIICDNSEFSRKNKNSIQTKNNIPLPSFMHKESTYTQSEISTQSYIQNSLIESGAQTRNKRKSRKKDTKVETHENCQCTIQ